MTRTRMKRRWVPRAQQQRRNMSIPRITFARGAPHPLTTTAAAFLFIFFLKDNNAVRVPRVHVTEKTHTTEKKRENGWASLRGEPCAAARKKPVSSQSALK